LFPGTPILHENGFAQVTRNDPDLGRELPPEVADVLEPDRPADFPDRSFRRDEAPLGKVDSPRQPRRRTRSSSIAGNKAAPAKGEKR